MSSIPDGVHSDEETGMGKMEDGQIAKAASSDFNAYERLKGLHADLLAASGQLWNWPALATMTRPTLARLLYLNGLYDRILGVPGVICEFGAHYGTSSAVLTNLRALKEPYNYSRTLYVFDTFEGFAGTTSYDGAAADGDFRLPTSYDETLDEILSIHEGLSPQSHIVKHRIYKGDASSTVHDFLADAPHAIVSMAIFDMDIYQPTRDVLEALLPRMPRGSLLVFDELNHADFPGETRALDETVGIAGVRLQRDPAMPYCAWAVVGD